MVNGVTTKKDITVLILFHSVVFAIRKKNGEGMKCRANTNKPKQMNLKTKDKKKNKEEENHGRDTYTDIHWKSGQKTKCTISPIILFICIPRTASSHISIFPVSLDVFVSYRSFFPLHVSIIDSIRAFYTQILKI